MVAPIPMNPRKKCAAATREAILAAARSRFLADSYDSVGLREVAREAGVDVALVSRYFGGKEELFKEVLRGDRPRFEVDLSAAELPAFLVSLLAVENDCVRRDSHERLLIMLRSASSPTASQVVRKAFREDVLAPLANIIGGPDATMKAALAMAVLLGSSLLKSVLNVEPMDEDQRERMRQELLRLLETALAPRSDG